MVRMAKRCALVALLACLGLPVFSANQALAVHVSCQDILFTDTTLDSDLYCPGSRALDIGASNITLDLAGHSIGAPVHTFFAGLQSINHSGVTIENGMIYGYSTGIDVLAGQGNTVRNMSVYSSDVGIYVRESQTNLVERNFVDGASQIGINVCCVTGMTPGGSNQVLRNTVRQRLGYAIHLDTPSNTASRNVVLGSQEGIRVTRSTGNVVQDNFMFGIPGAYPLDVGVSLFRSANSNTVERNYVTDARLAGIRGYGGVTANVIRNNLLWMGAAGVLLSGESIRPTNDNQVLANSLFNNTGDGVRVESFTSGTLVEGNFAKGNGDDGVDVDVPGATITGNTANYNLDLGIEAEAGVVDGGGNTATGNGNAAQCVNVSCP